MTDLILTKTRLIDGAWEGLLRGPAADKPPVLMASHAAKRVEGLAVVPTDAPGEWAVRLPIPPELIADGLQTFLILDGQTGETLTSFSVLAGDALAEDIRAEVDLLRAELDMLKRAFRRHCVETT